MIKHTTKIPKLVLWYMNFLEYDGYASLWNTIYYKTDALKMNKRFVKHELHHYKQMKRDGKLWYALKYNWYRFSIAFKYAIKHGLKGSLRHGYWTNPYEIEARQAEVLL